MSRSSSRPTEHPHCITLSDDPYVLIRPEGQWDVPGILEKSASRSASVPPGWLVTMNSIVDMRSYVAASSSRLLVMVDLQEIEL